MFVTRYKCAMMMIAGSHCSRSPTRWWLTPGRSPDSPCTVLMQWTPEVPFLPLTTLSVAERNMYLVPPTVTPFMASSSVLAYLPSKPFSSSTETCNGVQYRVQCSTGQCRNTQLYLYGTSTTVRTIDNLQGGINRDKVVLIINHCCLLVLHYFAS